MRKVRFTALLLTMSLLLVLPVSAETGTPFPDVSAEDSCATAVTTLYRYDIIRGDDKGNFNPNATISRAEYAAILCRLMGEEDTGSRQQPTVFSDILSNHWASGYVTWATREGILSGYGNGSFGPADPVTVEQVAKTLVCAWGYESAAQAAGGWPAGYVSVARELGMLEGISGSSSAAASRSTVSIIIYQAMSAPFYGQQD